MYLFSGKTHLHLCELIKILDELWKANPLPHLGRPYSGLHFDLGILSDWPYSLSKAPWLYIIGTRCFFLWRSLHVVAVTRSLRSGKRLIYKKVFT